jgi:hypothetical protein
VHYGYNAAFIPRQSLKAEIVTSDRNPFSYAMLLVGEQRVSKHSTLSFWGGKACRIASLSHFNTIEIYFQGPSDLISNLYLLRWRSQSLDISRPQQRPRPISQLDHFRLPRSRRVDDTATSHTAHTAHTAPLLLRNSLAAAVSCRIVFELTCFSCLLSFSDTILSFLGLLISPFRPNSADRAFILHLLLSFQCPSCTQPCLLSLRIGLL